MTPYSTEFYEDQQEGSRRSANKIVPIVVDIVQPRSVVDVGCGVGTWLAVFAEHGIRELWGVEGEHVDRTLLQIPQESLVVQDLTKPIDLGREFDLVVCLEVAEHLPAESASILIDGLTRLGRVILFSAAIPHQGGTHHVNEQWPEYWAERFAARNYVPVDCIREAVWQDNEVEWWYAQNTFLYVEAGFLEGNRSRFLRPTGLRSRRMPLSLIHPQKYLESVFRLELALQGSAIVPPGASFILVDDASYGIEAIPGRKGLPFLEREGEYWGKPADDDEAIRELERMRAGGSGVLIFVWSSFWWLEHYSHFRDYLRSRFKCVADNPYMIVFDLCQAPDRDLSDSSRRAD